MNKKVSGMERDFIIDMLIREQIQLVSDSHPACIIQLIARDEETLRYAELGEPVLGRAVYTARAARGQSFSLELMPEKTRTETKTARIPAYIISSDLPKTGKASRSISLTIAVMGKSLEFSGTAHPRKTEHTLILLEAPLSYSLNTTVRAIPELRSMLASRQIVIVEQLKLPTLCDLCSQNKAMLFLDRQLGLPEQDPTIGNRLITRKQFEEIVKKTTAEKQARIKEELIALSSLNKSVCLYPCSLLEAKAAENFTFTLPKSALVTNEILNTITWLDAVLVAWAATNTGTVEGSLIAALFTHGLVLASKETLPETSSIFQLSIGKRTLRGSAITHELLHGSALHWYYFCFEHIEPEDLRFIADHLCEKTHAETVSESYEFAKLCGL